MTDEEAATTPDDYAVVLNDEEQYSLWPADRQPPAGWRTEGTIGTRAVCLERIDRVWLDTRPRSLRERTAETDTGPAAYC